MTNVFENFLSVFWKAYFAGLTTGILLGIGIALTVVMIRMILHLRKEK